MTAPGKDEVPFFVSASVESALSEAARTGRDINIAGALYRKINHGGDVVPAAEPEDEPQCTCKHYVVDYSDPERYHPENVDREEDPACPVHGAAAEPGGLTEAEKSDIRALFQVGSSRELLARVERILAARTATTAETYTVEEIQEAFAKHAGPDDWGVRAFYENGLIAALRGEYDAATERGPRPHGVACAVLHMDAEGRAIPCPGYPHAATEGGEG